jgi:hypothetical protein
VFSQVKPLKQLPELDLKGAERVLNVVLIPMKVIIDSDLIPVTGSEVKLIVFGAKRRWHSYRA